MPGLTSIWEQVLHTLARPLDNAHADSLRESIITTSENLRRQLNDHQIRTENLKRPSRQAYAWLRYFAIPGQLQRVCLDGEGCPSNPARGDVRTAEVPFGNCCWSSGPCLACTAYEPLITVRVSHYRRP
jgi:hypothetical protein